MKIIAFNGSPRKNGNTSDMLKEILRGALEHGAETKIYHLNNMKIKGCQSCFYCKNHDLCSIKDDMEEIYQDFKDADAVIIGSPIFLLQVSAQTKLLMDRLYAVSDKNLKGKFGEKKCIFVYSQGHSNEEYFKDYFNMNDRIVNILGLKTIDRLVASDADELHAAANNNELMKTAYLIGKNLAQ